MASSIMEIAPVHDEQHRRRLAVLTESLTQALEQVDVTIPKDFYGYIVERTSREVCKDVWEVGQCGVWSAELYEHKVLFHSWGFITWKIPNPPPCPFVAPENQVGPPYSADLLKHAFMEQVAADQRATTS